MSGKIMQNYETTSSADKSVEADGYKAPHLVDYGPVSELTEAIQGDTGFDGAGTPSSYTAST